MDLIIVDIPEGLHVPTISAPPAPIPTWNVFSTNWLVPVFDFAQEYLHDRGGILVMYPSSVPHKSHLLGCCQQYGFKVAQSWLGMNRLHLTLPSNPTMTVTYILYFAVLVLNLHLNCKAFLLDLFCRLCGLLFLLW